MLLFKSYRMAWISNVQAVIRNRYVVSLQVRRLIDIRHILLLGVRSDLTVFVMECESWPRYFIDASCMSAGLCLRILQILHKLRIRSGPSQDAGSLYQLTVYTNAATSPSGPSHPSTRNTWSYRGCDV